MVMMVMIIIMIILIIMMFIMKGTIVIMAKIASVAAMFRFLEWV